ncbi:MAG TPA: spore coat U domain-containing protein [Nevskia sp.]|nr:spore coat U domain-containing protein [Nevskia sp.]
MNRIARLLLPGVACLLWLHPATARAQSCSASAPSLNFGSVDVVSGGNYPGSTTVTITCNMGLLSVGTINYSLCLGIPGASGTTPRKMNGTVSYNLYSDSGTYNTVWGSYGGSPGLPSPPNPVSLTTSSLLLGGSNSTTIQVYGYLQSGQNSGVAAGSYSDTQTATLNYNYTYSLLGTPATPTSCAANGGNTSGGTLPMTSTAVVVNNCVVSATPVNFGGSVGVLTGAVTASGTITARCTSGDNYSIALNQGTTSGGSIADRQMIGSGSAVVHYQLYTGSNYGTIWGDGTTGATQGGTGSGANQGYTVYGRVQAQATPAPDTYKDTITVTVTY